MRHRNYKKPLFSPFSYTSDQESTYEDHFCTKHWKISLNSEHIHLRERPPSKSCVWEQCLFIKVLGHLTFLTPPASTPSSPWNTTCQKKEEIVRQSHQAFPTVQFVERSESVNRRDISSFSENEGLDRVTFITRTDPNLSRFSNHLLLSRRLQ